MENTFGDNLKRLREERGLSQEQFAKILETSKQVVSRYETGQRSPKVDVVSEYAKKLNISITELTGYEEKPATGEGDGLDEDIREIQSILDRLGPEERKEVLKFVKFQASERNE